MRGWEKVTMTELNSKLQKSGHKVLKTEEEKKGGVKWFNNKKVQVDGIVFDSKLEYQVYQLLKHEQRNGKISDLKVHDKIELCINGVSVTTYEPDFTYKTIDGKDVIHEVKGKWTDYALLKNKFFKALFKGTGKVFIVTMRNKPDQYFIL